MRSSFRLGDPVDIDPTPTLVPRIRVKRRFILVGAWKAYLNDDGAIDLARSIASELGSRDPGFDLAVCPSFVSIVGVRDALRDTPVAVGAQNVFWADTNGAFTGQVTASQLVSVGCRYVILGHSELRQLGETDEMVNDRVGTALAFDLAPIVCVGESAEERREGRTKTRVEQQVRAAIDGIDPSVVAKVHFAYEPLWAIKSHNNPDATPATVEQAAEMHHFIRDTLTEALGAESGSAIRVLYGGSVGPENAGELISVKEIDGLLVGSASVKSTSFLQIVGAVGEVASGSFQDGGGHA